MSGGNPNHDPRTGEFSSGHNAGGGNRSVARHVKEQLSEPKHLGDAVTAWAQGKIKSAEVQRVFKKSGWSVNLRRGNYEVESYDPSGRHHYIAP